jgi:toxin FitB
MFKWRLLVNSRGKVGHTFSQPDPIIAATAIHYGLSVVTRNRGDHQRASVEVFNPWTDQLSKK